METPNRDELEYELAAALLALWILLSDVKLVGSQGYSVFLAAFNREVRPILVRVYGNARASVAEEFGLGYETTTSSTGEPVTKLPGLERRIDRYARDLYGKFQGKQQEAEARQAEPDYEPFPDHYSRGTAASTVTDLQTEGEMDAARDVEVKTGQRLVAVWRTEPGSCPLCSPFDGTIEKWQREWPQGPKRHPNCRCWLEWRVLLS